MPRKTRSEKPAADTPPPGDLIRQAVTTEKFQGTRPWLDRLPEDIREHLLAERDRWEAAGRPASQRALARVIIEFLATRDVGVEVSVQTVADWLRRRG